MRKALAVFLSVVMVVCALPVFGFAAQREYTSPASAYAAYDANAVEAGEVDNLSYDQIAAIILDWLDRKIAATAGDFDSFEVEALGQTVSVDLDINGIDDILKYSGYLTELGGDFATLNTASLSGLSRAGGDINFIYAMLQFMGDNADKFGKVFSWEEGQTFDFGKVGEYIEGLEADNEIRKFYEDYLIGNDIQQKFTDEIAREMDYTIGEGETLDDVINNGILAIVTDFCGDNGILSDAAINNIKASFNLRTTDIYTLIKDFVGVVQSDNQVKIDTYYNFYLDNYVRTALKVMFGYQPAEGAVIADAAAVKAEFAAVYSDLALLYELSDGKVYFRDSAGAYYVFTVTDSAVTEVKALTWENALGINFAAPTVGIYSKASGTPDLVLGSYNCALVKAYHPTSESYDLHVYSPYGNALADSGVTVEAAAAPAEYTALMTDENYKAMDEFFAMAVTQDSTITESTVITFAELEEFAEEQALAVAQSMAQSMGATVKSVDVTLSYNGYATDDEFIMNVTAAVTASAEMTVEFGGAPITVPVNNFDVSSAIQNPVATVVVDNLSGSEAILDAAALLDFVDSDFAIDDSFIDFSGNYDEFNGAIGQSNNVLCGLLEMLLSDSGYESLGLVEGGNENLTDNLQKLCTKADGMITAAKEFMGEEGFESFIAGTGINDLFASSHGFNADMVYNMDFSSVENLYVCAIEMVLDFIDDETPGIINDLHTAVEGLESLDQMAVAFADYALEKAIAGVQEFIASFNTEYGTTFSFNYTLTKTDASTITDNAKDVILTKVVDLGLNALTFAIDDAANYLINDFIHALNTNLELGIGDVSFELGVTAGASWEATANAVVDRIAYLLNGILIAAGDIEAGDGIFDKLSTLANAVLPLGTMFSNSGTESFECDLGKLADIAFNEILDGDFDNFLALFEAYNATDNNKPADIANGASVNYALIKASDYIVDAFFPDTVNAELYTDSATVQDTFTSSANDADIAERNMISINARKYALVPAALVLAQESGVLESLVVPCQHENTVAVDAVAATCIATGLTAGVYCNDCERYISGHTETAVNPANHVGALTDTAAVTATCVSTGYTAGKLCSACNRYASGHETVAINASNHVHTRVVGATAPTCTAGGYTQGTYCDDCARYVSGHDAVAATGHIDSDGNGFCDGCNADLREPEPAPSFVEKIKAFFQKILDFFKSLFG